MDRAFIFVLFLAGIAIGYFGHSELVKSPVFSPEQNFVFTPANVTKGQTEFACSAVATGYVGRPMTENGKLTGELHSGTDKLSISFDFEEGVMKLITAIAVEAGETEAENFTIVENDEKNAVAIAKHGILGPNYSVIVFDKETQQAVWTKAAGGLLNMGSVIYLNCL